MKKKLKIFGVSILVLMLLLFILPFAFKGKIVELVKQSANNSINATLDFESADLSLLSSFPNVSLSLNSFYIQNEAPFQGDTLVSAEQIDITLPFKSLFNDANEPISVKSFQIEGATVAIKVDSLGNANYDIAKKDGTANSNTTEESTPFQFNLERYDITNSAISYDDMQSHVYINLTDFNHSGRGNLSADQSVLKTTSNAVISLGLDHVEYIKNQQLELIADLNLNFKENRYTFLENSAKINELPLVFDGFIKVNETSQEVDLSFETPSSDFKNFLSLIPKVYSKNIEGVRTTGNFDVKGEINGIVDETHIPTFDVRIISNDASFKYPDLPKSLDNIQINTVVANKTGLAKDTYVAIDQLNFTIDKEPFAAKARLTNLTDNMKVSSNLTGKLDLSKLEQLHPADQLKGLRGLIDANMNAAFDMQSIEQKKYENTKVSGTANIRDFVYNSAELKNPLKVAKTELVFNPKAVQVQKFTATLGDTDMNASGNLENFLGFLFNEENLKGKFELQSNNFVVNDFMSAAITNEKSADSSAIASNEQLRIPSFLDAQLQAKANTVVYDNITLKNVSGDLNIKDQTASLQNMKSDVFGGQLGFNGSVATKSETPTFSMQLDVDNFNIGESFASLDFLKALAPIAKAVQGKINTNITLSGNLNNDFTPVLESLSGDMLAQLFSSKLNTQQTPLLQELTSKLSFFDAKKLNLDDLKASLRFKDGKVSVKPFSLAYDDIEIAVGGGHGFDRSMDYDAVFSIPAKYLGKEAEKLLAQLSPEEQNTLKVPVTALLTGSFTKPSISTDLKSAISSLTKQVASNQKDKLVNKGKEELTNALDKLLNKNKDTTKVDSAKTNTQDAVKETATDLIKGLFGKKKKKPEEKKDTVD